MRKQTPDGQLRAEDLPESCRAWFDIGQTAGAAEGKTDLPVAAQADRGITDTGLGLPAMMIDGSTLVQVGGVLGAYDIFNLGEVILRGGTTLFGNINDSDGAHLVLESGKLHNHGCDIVTE